MPGHFEVFRGEDEQWYYRFKGGNGENMFTGEGYSTQAHAVRGTGDVVASIREMLVDENGFTVKLVPEA